MKLDITNVVPTKEILYNDDWAGVPHKFTADTKAGDIIPGMGVCLYDVFVDENPNGTVVYRGVINAGKLEDTQKPTGAQIAALPLLKWIDPKTGEFLTGE